MQCSFASIWSWSCFINTEQTEILTRDCDIFMIFINSDSGNHTVSIRTKCHHIYSVVVELFQFGPKSPTDPLTSQRPASCLARPKTSSRLISARRVWERWCFSKAARGWGGEPWWRNDQDVSLAVRQEMLHFQGTMLQMFKLHIFIWFSCGT